MSTVTSSWWGSLRALMTLWTMPTVPKLAGQVTARGGEGYSPIKVTGYLSGNFENTSKRYQNLVLWACPKWADEVIFRKKYQKVSNVFLFCFFFSLRRKDIRARCNFQTVFQFLLHCINSLAIKVTGYLSENFENTSKRYQNLVLWECPKFISTPKRQFFCIL